MIEVRVTLGQASAVTCSLAASLATNLGTVCARHAVSGSADFALELGGVSVYVIPYAEESM